MNVGNFSSTMFGTIFGNNSNGNSSSISLADYAAIRNGSYKKALKAYYASDNGKEALQKAGYKSSATTISGKDSNESLARMQTSAKELSESTSKLLQGGKKSVFATGTTKDSNGKEYDAYDYDVDKIYDAVKDFVKDYNSTIDNVVSTNTNSIAQPAAAMINLTDSHKALLDNIGISIDKDYKLSIDEEAFKKANMGDVKSLFNTQGGYGYQVAAKASSINYNAQSEMAKSSSYSNRAHYNYYSIAGSSFDTNY